MSVEILLDRKTDLEAGSIVTIVKSREPFAQSTRTRKEIYDWNCDHLDTKCAITAQNCFCVPDGEPWGQLWCHRFELLEFSPQVICRDRL